MDSISPEFGMNSTSPRAFADPASHMESSSNPCISSDVAEDPTVSSRLQGIEFLEQRYRDSWATEVSALEKQLLRARSSIEKLQLKLLDFLDCDFKNPQSTAHIHRELSLLLNFEKTVVGRIAEVREKSRTSHHRQLIEQRRVCDFFVPNEAGAKQSTVPSFPLSSAGTGQGDTHQSLHNMQTHNNVRVARVQVPNIADQIKELLTLINNPVMIQKPPADLQSDTDGHVVTDPNSPSKPIFPQPSPAPPLPSVKPKKQYHAFLTHNWGDASANHERVKQICHALKSMGLNLWFDEERLGANVIQEMTSGIDQSDVVVVFVTTTYCLKIQKPDYDNCKIEFMYAVNRMCSMMVAVPLDEDVLLPQSWSGPVGAILGCNLYPAKFWDNGAITPQRPEFAVQVQKLYDRIVSLCEGNGDGSSSVVSNSPALPASGDGQLVVKRQFFIPKKRTHHEFFLAQRIKFCYKVALHACATSSEQRDRLENARKFSLSRMHAKFDTLYDRGIRVRDAFTTIIDTRGNCDVEPLVERLDELDTNFVRHVAELAAPPHSEAKFERYFQTVQRLQSEGKTSRLADLESVLLFHAFLLGSPKYVSSDDFLVEYARVVLKEESLSEMDTRGWIMSGAFARFWNGERDIDVLFPNSLGDGELRTVRLFNLSARAFCTNTGLDPELGCARILPGDVDPYFSLLVFIKTLGDLAHSQQTHKDLWTEIDRLFDTQPPLRSFKEVVSLVQKQNEWAANIPGPDASDLVKQRYSLRLDGSLKQLTRARADLKSCDPSALELWNRASQHAPTQLSDLNGKKLSEINIRRRLGGIVKIVLFLACKPPSAKGKAAHNRLVDDVLEVLQNVPIIDLSGQSRTMSLFAPIVKHAIRDIIENCVPCAEIAATKCPGDDVALLFAQELDALIWELPANTELLEKLELEFHNFLKPVAAIAVGRIGVADMMFEVEPVDTHTEQLLSRAAELCFPRYSTTTSGRVCAGGPSQEKEKIIQNWSKKVPDVRTVLTALWSNPHDFDAAVRGIPHRRTVWFCRRIFNRCQRLAPLDTVEYFLHKNEVSMERIANLRDHKYYSLGRHRFCSGGPEVERQRVVDVTFPNLRMADCDVQNAVQALWSGERRSAVLLSMCPSQLAKEWMQGAFRFMDDIC